MVAEAWALIVLGSVLTSHAQDPTMATGKGSARLAEKIGRIGEREFEAS